MISWILCAISCLIIILLLVKIWLLKKDVDDICTELTNHLSHTTNTLITTSSNDAHIKRVAAKLNKELRILRKQRQQYENGSRELKEAITNISHDLRTPLTAISGYLDLLTQEETSPSAKQYIDVIQNRVLVLEQLMEELFRYSLISSNDTTPLRKNVAINDILEESIAEFYAILKEHEMKPLIHMPETKIYRNIDPSALSRICSNLLNNAIKYSDGDLNITLTKQGELIFANTASNLNEVEVGKLFHRYYTVETAKNSTGLGLAISRNLVEQMNGSISAEYKDGKLIIHVKLPE